MVASPLAQQLELPNGTTLKNRVAKAAMSEQLGNKQNGPTEGLVKLYETWGKGGAGLLITGNVMIDRRALGEPANVALEDDRDLELIGAWAKAAQAEGAQAVMQINHPGRQSPRNVVAEPLAPSAVPLEGFGGVFATPRAMTEAEIKETIQRFAATAGLAVRGGFAGVEVHGAHGYLISQFLSPHTNRREDGWGGTAEKRRRFLFEVLKGAREAMGPRATLALKLNSADFQRGGFSEEESMDVVRLLNDTGLDLLEISGGTYEQPPQNQGKPQRESTRKREAYFLEYAEKVRAITNMPLMLTGGMRSAEGMAGALAGGVDVVGLARPMAVEPDLPNRLLSGETEEALKIELQLGIKKLDDFLEVSWYQQQLMRMAKGQLPDPKSCRVGAVIKGLVHAFTHRPSKPR